MEKFLENLQEAEKIIKIADHMVYVTFPLVQDKILLLKILSELKIAISKCINSILQYEYLFKRIKLFSNPKQNFRNFQDKCAKRYNITKQEIDLIKELFEIIEKHKQSSFEFKKGDKIVIMTENFTPKSVALEDIKKFLVLGKNILKKTLENIKTQF